MHISSINNTIRNSIHNSILTSLLLITPALWIYGRILGYPFIEIDDGGQIFENPLVTTLSLENVLALFSTPVVGMYQPLTSVCNTMIVALVGQKHAASALHSLALLLHILNTHLFYTIGLKCCQQKGKALLIALILSAHPLIVESVAWISALSTLWFTLFFLLSLNQYLVYCKQNSTPALQSAHYRYSLLFFILGCFCKVQIVPLVGVLILVDLLKKRSTQHPRRILILILEKLPFALVAILFLGIALHFRSQDSGFPNYGYSPFLLFPNQLIWYPYKLFLPINLGIQYDWPITAWTFFTALSYVIVISSLVLIAYFRQRITQNDVYRFRLFVFGLLFYLGNILLHTTFFTQFLGPYADRYAYLSSFGILIALFSLLPNHYFTKFNSLFGFIIIGLCWLAIQQTQTWQNTISVWSHNLKHQNATFSHGMRGALYFKQGLLPLAKADFEKFAQNPDIRLQAEKYAYLYTQLAIMTAPENPKKAADYFLKVTQYEQSYPVYMNLVKIYQQLGKEADAEVALQKAQAVQHIRHKAPSPRERGNNGQGKERLLPSLSKPSRAYQRNQDKH